MADNLKSNLKTIDPIQDAMGIMGPWQIMITIAISLINFPAAWNQLAIAVIAPGQNFTCISPAPINPNDSMIKACFVKVNHSLPEVKCTEFTYDQSVFKSTIISEWDLVCDRKILLSLVQSLTQLGILIGNLVFGIYADKVGRKTPLMIAVVIQAVTGIITAFMPLYELFLLFKFISAIATGGTMLISFVIVMEIIGVETRSNILTLFHIPFVLGFLCVPLFSYLTRTWDGYWLTISIPAFTLLSFYWLIPESPRWLLAVGKVEQAREVLVKAAKRNKISEDKVTAAIIAHENLSTKDTSTFNNDGSEYKTYNVIDLVRTPNMRIKTLCIVFNWFKCGMVFFGIEHYLGHLSENVLSDLAISAAFQFPGLLLVYILISRVSRLKILIGANVLSGISLLLIVAFYDSDTIKLILVTIGITCMTVSFPTIYLYTGELFPTVVRNIGFAVCSVASKLGSMVAPFLIDNIDDLAFWIVPVVFGLGPILGAILCYWLPETMDCRLPETIEDGENFKKQKKRTSVKCPI
ncbi:organic cation transporter protein [Microplitis demolitor]|uniref:organic cation transporter protein n=1 Tax=Microplitis demolitor TaxID=69319 RepID=UPI0004CDD594|nr:organic cation transporter protein [Microplitis demolitor]